MGRLERHYTSVAVLALLLCVSVMSGFGCWCGYDTRRSETWQPTQEEMKEYYEKNMPPLYPGAIVDTSQNATSKLQGEGVIYIVSEPEEKVIEFYERELAGKPEFARTDYGCYTYKNEAGDTIELFIMSADAKNTTTNLMFRTKLNPY